jgi:hypothetical protein
MKRLVFALAALAFCLPLRADPVTDAYKKGMAAVERGDVEAARASFNEALRLQPNHPHARFQLNELNRNADAIAARVREKELAKYTLDQVDFHDVEASEAILALGIMVEKKSEKKFSPNFTIQDPGKVLEQRKVTLQLKGVPASAVLKMIAEQSGALVIYEKHAIIVRGPEGAAKKADTETAPK